MPWWSTDKTGLLEASASFVNAWKSFVFSTLISSACTKALTLRVQMAAWFSSSSPTRSPVGVPAFLDPSWTQVLYSSARQFSIH